MSKSFSAAEKVLFDDLVSGFTARDLHFHPDKWMQMTDVERAARVLGIHMGVAVSWDVWESLEAGERDYLMSIASDIVDAIELKANAGG